MIPYQIYLRGKVVRMILHVGPKPECRITVWSDWSYYDRVPEHRSIDHYKGSRSLNTTVIIPLHVLSLVCNKTHSNKNT